MHIVLALMQQL
jgi:hypothetical protein